MNEITHFFTGYFIARLFKNGRDGGKHYRHNDVMSLYTAIAALLPDITEVFFIGAEHATWTHTILISSIIAIIYATIIYLSSRKLLRKMDQTYLRLVILSVLGTLSHLFLDTFTHQQFNCEGSLKHIYFWPLWDQSFHIDCLFGWNYLSRIIIEWAIYNPILIILIIYRWKKYNENVFEMFIPKNWIKNFDDINLFQDIKKDKILKLNFIALKTVIFGLFSLIILALISYFI